MSFPLNNLILFLLTFERECFQQTRDRVIDSLAVELFPSCVVLIQKFDGLLTEDVVLLLNLEIDCVADID